MKKREPVTHIMTADVHTADLATDNLHSVKNLIDNNKLRHVPITQHNKLVGIVSKTDINRLTFGSLFEGQETADEAVLEMLKIEQVMSGNPKAISPETTIREAAELFANEEYHSLPVVENDKVVGIVTTTDVIKYMIEQY